MKLPPLILASASPRRSELLRQLGLPFGVEPSQAPEIHSEALTAAEQCIINAARKARAIASRRPASLVIGADTLVTLDNEHLGKPRDLREAERMLLKLQGRTHQVVTGICLHHTRGQRERTFAVLTEVTFRPLTAARIRQYHQAVDPLDKAGAYAIQEHGDWIIESIDGSYSNVVGLPLERLLEELRAWETGQ